MAAAVLLGRLDSWGDLVGKVVAMEAAFTHSLDLLWVPGADRTRRR